MAHGVRLAILVEVRFVAGAVQVEVFVEKRPQICAAVHRAGQDFDAIASAQNHSLAHPGNGNQLLQRLRQSALWNRKLLPYVYRGTLVIHADEMEIHGLASLCTELK